MLSGLEGVRSSIEYMVASSSASQSERTVEHRGESSGEGDGGYDEGGEVFRKIMVGLQDRILEPLEPFFAARLVWKGCNQECCRCSARSGPACG